MSAYTPEPWRYRPCTIGHPDNALNPMIDAGGMYIARLHSQESTIFGMTSLAPGREEAEANAVRVTNCINACAGIPNEVLESVIAANKVSGRSMIQEALEVMVAIHQQKIQRELGHDPISTQEAK